MRVVRAINAAVLTIPHLPLQFDSQVRRVFPLLYDGVCGLLNKRGIGERGGAYTRGGGTGVAGVAVDLLMFEGIIYK